MNFLVLELYRSIQTSKFQVKKESKQRKKILHYQLRKAEFQSVIVTIFKVYLFSVIQNPKQITQKLPLLFNGAYSRFVFLEGSHRTTVVPQPKQLPMTKFYYNSL